MTVVLARLALSEVVMLEPDRDFQLLPQQTPPSKIIE
jgi:hypothetical protein